MERLPTDTQTGLSREEVRTRTQQGLINGEEEMKTQSVGQIVRKNIITPFNILNLILGALVFSVGSYKNMLFIGVAVCNTIVGCFQEIRAKKTIDKLSLISSPKAHVLRDGKLWDISVSHIVLDDILQLTTGNQICSDCVVASGSCEVNESLITGESDPIVKQVGDHLLSGSFIVSGTCRAQVEHVGKENYAAKITGSAKYVKKTNSEIMKSINLIIRIIGFALIPVGLVLFYKEMVVSNSSYAQAIVSTVAALVGMVPEGLVLLTSIVLASSVVRLSFHNALVQELYSIEMLARVDTICLDKTGTITEGAMQVDEMEPLINTLTPEQMGAAVAAVTFTLQDQNPTAQAMREKYPDNPGWESLSTVPFSSARKWSGVNFADHGTFVIGAGEFIMGERFASLHEKEDKAAAKGQRVLLLAHSSLPFEADGRELPTDIQPIALLYLSDRIRKSARETLQYFADQNVDLKVISGDSAVTVANIAKKAGLEHADRWVDATTLHTNEEIQAAVRKYTVFGRVTPQQKLQIVKALKADGHTVAMTGDGVNDVLALKESDCSIAMASGSDAARTVSQIVLLDSDFASMPHIVAEGRRSINNLQRSSSLFLIKAFFSTILAVCFIFIQSRYPFQPIQFTLLNALAIGFPSFVLSLEPNRERLHGRFMLNIIKKAIPGTLTMVFSVLLLEAVNFYVKLPYEQLSTAAVVLMAFTMFMILFRVCMPFNGKHVLLFVTMCVAFVLAYIFMGNMFSLTPLNAPMLLILLPLIFASVSMFMMFLHLIERILMRRVN
ncbi:cation-translocating P-type ATPase [Caproicibacterium lactatifermentans]|jgi:cation-transporting ATPase E|uniref:HAD-IC family P-type ATPase n=1 Tax=Caproicibacterium lactatifermentans TaxID=2666138 RepID=A0A859DQD8_9FIRM|nr:cation-translocating P-type ATPase [Caproicibacterium lactatifermentans]QKN23739.1 HAD-IC family P-type ATPase [Caproicibacterium lactatifermentans]